jgi:L-tartrate/succinate antiporter
MSGYPVSAPAPANPPPAPAARSDRWWRIALPLVCGGILAVLPTPAGLTPGAWHYFALFTTILIGLITEPIPATAVAFVGITAAAVLGLPFTAAQSANPSFQLPAEAVKWVLAGFSNGTVWLIFAAFVFAMGYEKTGLGRRLALLMVKSLGSRTLGLGYAVAFSDLVLSPFTPSNTARSAGTVYPVIRNIPELYGSQPGPTARRIGAYLMYVAFATTCVTSSMFITALAPNLLILEMVKKATGVEVTWGEWALGFLPVGGLLVLTLPWILYKFYPPEIRTSAEVPQWAEQQLKTMGRVTRRELTMAALALVALSLWIFGGDYIDATLVAIGGVSLMLVTGVVTWDEITGNKPAWNVLAWFATLVVLADGLNRVGFVGWIGKWTAAALSGYPPLVVMTLLVALFFLIHYMFAGLTAHTTAVLPVVLAAGVSVPGLPVKTFIMMLGYCLGIMGILTPFATGPAPLYYGCGFIERKDFWKLGFIYGLLFLVLMLLICTPWLGVLNR